MKQSRTPILCLALFFCLYTTWTYGQNLDSLLHNKRVYHAVHIGDLDKPRIDGILDEAIWSLGEWQGAFTQQQPVGGVEPTERTYVKVLYDYSNLFVAIKCMDQEAELIRDMLDRRDALTGDMAGIALDSYFDRKTAFEFTLAASGQKMDLKHTGDYMWDFNWNAVWDGATSRHDSGWVAEMKVPFSQIRYTNKETHLWGMHVWRWIERRQEEDQWQYIPLEAPAMVYLFGNLEGVENIRGSRQVEFLPYVLSSVEKAAGGEGFDPPKFNGGVDAKVGISSDYTLDLTVNPDFGQVEADPSVLNLTAFETFYEEKRPFFLEGTEIFDFELDGDIPYYSRRIGSAPQFPSQWKDYEIWDLPMRSTILGAAKLTGKSSRGLSVGLLNGLTAEEYAVAGRAGEEEGKIQVAPLSNYFASRIKKESNQGNSMAGGTFSLVNRIAPDSAVESLLPKASITGGLDLMQYWDNKNYYAEVKLIASQLSGSQEAILQKQMGPIHRFQRPDAAYLELDDTREQLTGTGGLIQAGKKGGKINFNVRGQYRSPGLNLNDMGYIKQVDFIGSGGDITYRINEPGNWIRNYSLTLFQEARWSFGGENTLNELGAKFSLRSNKLWNYALSYAMDFSHLDIRELRGGPALRVDGEHQVMALIGSNSSKDFSGRLGGHVNWFRVKGSHQQIAFAELIWLPLKKIRLSAQASMNWRTYHQQYVGTLSQGGQSIYLVGQIDQKTPSFTFRGEFFLNPEMSIQYYGSPFFSVGKYSGFKRVDQSGMKEVDRRLEDLDVIYYEEENLYTFDHKGYSWSFGNPDFGFSQFRSNLVFRWEYHPGSTLYLVWAHDRSYWQGAYHPVSDMMDYLFRAAGNHIIMFKLNFWFSV